MPEQDFSGEFRSPGGFVFGVQGWTWGDQRAASITFFLDNTAMVCDQHGRPIKGTVVDNKILRFAITPPEARLGDDTPIPRPLATHLQVVEALAVERIDWKVLSCAGWPQLPYAHLKELKSLPPTPARELAKIVDPALRRDALRAYGEVSPLRKREVQELQATGEES